MRKALQDAHIERLKDAVREVDPELFHRHQGGWIESIGIALLDAVYSMNSRYSGVKRRLDSFRFELERGGISTDSLAVIAGLEEDRIRTAMGGSKVAPGRKGSTSKAVAVKCAARAIGSLGVDSAEQAREHASRSHGAKEILSKYSSVYGLGPITGEYFLMLLGIPGVKADRMLVRFVERAIGQSIDPVTARKLLVRVHQEQFGGQPSTISLIQFDHGIWLHERSHHDARRA